MSALWCRSSCTLTARSRTRERCLHRTEQSGSTATGTPQRLCYRFPRSIDYGAAACLLLRRRVFAELGGFDSRYAPAYYEDADLGMRLAERGLRVMYEPRSTVTHVRYGSGGTDGAATLSERNRALFVERWAPTLKGRPWTFIGTSDQAVITARDALATPRILVLAEPGEHGGEIVQALVAQWRWARVTWASDIHTDGHDPGLGALWGRGWGGAGGRVADGSTVPL